MAIRLKGGIIDKLKAAGYTSYRIREEKIMGEATMQKIRRDEVILPGYVNKICDILDCHPGDILERVPTKADD